MWLRAVLVFWTMWLTAACGQPAQDTADSPPPDDILFEAAEPELPPPLPAEVERTRSELLEIAGRDSIRRLARRADAEPVFLSNFGEDDHFRHWDLMRRTGFDPNANLIELLKQPHGVRQVGSENWYIWPDLAARAPEDLAVERISFRDAARLRELVGEEGLDQIAEGQPYPGVRTAISETGAWRYFLHETPPQ